MSNMSYCRFQNTLHDLQECLHVLDNNEMNDDEKLSEEEEEAKEELIKTCVQIAEDYGEEIK